MEQLIPPGAEPPVDLLTCYVAPERPTPPDRPWVLLNMISSVDGAISIGGTSGALGGPADKQVFAAVRAVPDVILVGAGTVAAERYGPVRANEAARPLRDARGQEPVPRIAVVSASLRLDTSLPLFTAGEAAGTARPLVVTTRDADAQRRAEVEAVAEVVTAGEQRVDLLDALAQLHERGARIVLGEGGPTLNGQLVDAGVVDELCLTLSPLLVGGDSPRIVAGSSVADDRHLPLRHLLAAEDLLFLRYSRA